MFCRAEKERQRQAEKARKEDERRRDERKKTETKSKKVNQLDDEVKEEEATTTTTTLPPKYRGVVSADKMKPAKTMKDEITKKDKLLKEKKLKEEMPPYVDAQAVQHMVDRPKVAHAQNHQIGHNEAVSGVFFLTFCKFIGF